MKAYSGVYIPKNPDKWVIPKNGLGRGKIEWRSSWELKFMRWADDNSNITLVSSEPFGIKYYSNVDNKVRRYYPDFYVESKDKKILVEIKPRFECLVPKTQGKSKKRQIHESITYIRNQDKWKSAKLFCKKNDLEFVIMDEYSLGIRK